MARGNLAAARGAAARRGKSPTSEVDVRPDFHPEATKRPKLNPRPPKPMRGRCSFGIYVREMTALIGIGRYGTANITANISSDYECSRRINRAFDADRLPRPSRSRPTSDGA